VLGIDRGIGVLPTGQHHLVSIGRGGAAVNFADLIGLLVLSDWVAHHVTVGIGRYELPT
jgi:hypothetical protein